MDEERVPRGCKAAQLRCVKRLVPHGFAVAWVFVAGKVAREGSEDGRIAVGAVVQDDAVAGADAEQPLL